MDISEWSRKYNSFAAAKAEFGHPSAIAHETEDGKVIASYVVFEKNNKVYYLKGRINESSFENKLVYEANVKILKEAFPDWESTCTNYGDEFNCRSEGIHAYARTNGQTQTSGSGWECYVDYGSRCYTY